MHTQALTQSMTEALTDPLIGLGVGGILLSLPAITAEGKYNTRFWERTGIDTLRLLDHEGILRDNPGTDDSVVLDGALPYQGARVVQNLAQYSEEFDNAWWLVNTNVTVTQGVADNWGGNTAATLTADASSVVFGNYQTLTSGNDYAGGFWVRRRTGTGNISIAVGDSAYSTIAVTSVWQRFSVSNTTTSATTRLYVRLATSGDEVDIARGVLEDVTGQANQNPSEYQKFDSTNSFYGYAQYATANGNAVSSNVVTEAVGSALSPVPQLECWPASTNYYLNSDVPVTQTIDLTSYGTGDYTLSVLGTGTVTSADVGATGTGHGAASAGTDITFNLSVAGTVSFTVAGGPPDQVQVEKKAFATPPIETAGAAVSRAASALRHPFVGYFNQARGAVIMDIEFPLAAYQPASNDGFLTLRGTNASSVLYIDSTGIGILNTYDGSLASVKDLTDWSADDKMRMVTSWNTGGDMEVGGKNITQAGSWEWDATPSNYDGAYVISGGYITLGYATDQPLIIHDLSIYNKSMTTAEIEALD